MAESVIKKDITIVKSGNINFTIEANGTLSYNISFDNPLASNNYRVIITQNGAHAYVDLYFAIGNRTTTGFNIWISSARSNSVNTSIDYAVIA